MKKNQSKQRFQEDNKKKNIVNNKKEDVEIKTTINNEDDYDEKELKLFMKKFLQKYNNDDLPQNQYSSIKDEFSKEMLLIRKEMLESQINNQNKKFNQCCKVLCFFPNVCLYTTLWMFKIMISLFFFIFILVLLATIKNYLF